MKARVHVTLKNGVLDPEGKAIGNALHRLGFPEVGDVRQEGAVSPAYPQMYVPLAQVSGRSMVVALRTGQDPLALVPSLKQALASVDPNLALSRITTMDQRVANTLARPRVCAR